MQMNCLCSAALGVLLACTPAGLFAESAPAPDPLAGIHDVLKGASLTGVADVYYGYNANHPGDTPTEPFTPKNNQFGLNLIELQLDKPVALKTAPLGFRVTLGFGKAIDAMGPDGSDAESSKYLKEGYLSYMAPLGKGLQIDAGKFVTPAGAEVIESNQNWNYSRGLLFYNAIPYFHFGARAKYVFNDKFTVTGYAVNGWNNMESAHGDADGGFSLAWTATKKLTVTENYLGGARGFDYDGGSDFHLSDTVVAYNPTAKLSLLGNLDYGRLMASHAQDYAALALYAKYQFLPNTAGVVRYEYINDHDGLATLTGDAHLHLNSITVTGEQRLAGHLLARLEYRHDGSNENYFAYGTTGAAVKGQSTVKAGFIFVLEPDAK